MSYPYDLVVIGAGPGGYVAAIRAAQSGMKTAVVEEREAGGTCLNRGCIPTKALMHAAHVYSELGRCADLGIHVENPSYDIGGMYARKDAVVGQLRGGVEFLLKQNGVERITGRAAVTGPHGARVRTQDGERTLEAERILIATGARPARIPIPGIDLPGVITSDDLLGGEPRDYRSLCIIGGGVVGMEFATIFSALGCAVTVIEAMDRVVPTLDAEIGKKLAALVKRRGVTAHTGASVSRIVQGADGLTCHFTKDGAEMEVTAEAVLVSVGRRANTEGLFDGVEVECGRGIVVNDGFQTSIPSLYAIGDVVHGGIQLAHVASAQGCAAVDHMLGKPPEIDLGTVPSCVYTDPEIACVGLDVQQAADRGIDVRVGSFNMAGNGKSIISGDTQGFVKLVFDAGSGVLLGAQLLCARATDLISELANAIVNKQTATQLGAVIRPHPTYAEAVTEAVEDVDGRAIHSPPRKRK